MKRSMTAFQDRVSLLLVPARRKVSASIHPESGRETPWVQLEEVRA